MTAVLPAAARLAAVRQAAARRLLAIAKPAVKTLAEKTLAAKKLVEKKPRVKTPKAKPDRTPSKLSRTLISQHLTPVNSVSPGFFRTETLGKCPPRRVDSRCGACRGKPDCPRRDHSDDNLKSKRFSPGTIRTRNPESWIRSSRIEGTVRNSVATS
jgi:hypothetical protein